MRGALDGPEVGGAVKERTFTRISFAEALPAYAVGGALLVSAALRLASGMQPGETEDDIRPFADVSAGFGRLIAGVALLLLGYFAAKPSATRSTLLTVACLGAGTAAFLGFATTRTDSRLPLGLALAFAYPAAVAVVRLVTAGRAAQGERA
jgi:hypothetical protein